MNEPLIVLKGLEGNAPTQFVPAQEVLAPHLDTLMTAWWIVFFGVLAYVTTTNVVLPLFRRYFKTTA